jgi:hypothetical protein
VFVFVFVPLGLGCGPCHVLHTVVHVLAEVQETPGDGDNTRAATGADHSGALLQLVIGIL